MNKINQIKKQDSFPRCNIKKIKIEALYILTLSDRAVKLSRNLCQKSLNNGLSIFFKLSLVLASTLT